MENKAARSGNVQEKNSLDSYHKVRLRNVKCEKIITCNTNINSLPAKFEEAKEVIIKNIYNLVITETKLDDTVPVDQFFVEEFAMFYRLERNRNGGGLIIYKDIPSKILEKHKLPQDIKVIFI